MTKLKSTPDPGPVAPERDGIPEVLLENVGFLLNRSAARIREMFSRRLEPFGLTPKHYGVLLLLEALQPLSQQDIVARLGHDRTTMVNLVDELEAKGWVRREPQPADRRAYAVRLTPDGQARLDLTRPLARQTNQEFLAVLAPQGQRQLHNLLTRLALAWWTIPGNGPTKEAKS